MDATYSVQTRVVPLTALLIYQTPLAGWRVRGGAGAGVQLVRSWIGARSELSAVHGIDATADREETIDGYPRRTFENDRGEPIVETWEITGQGHATFIRDLAGVAENDCGLRHGIDDGAPQSVVGGH